MREFDFITTTAPQARYLGCLKTKRSGRKEPVMVIIGCDYHPSGQQVFGIDTESGEVVADRWIAHTGKEVEQCMAGGDGGRSGEQWQPAVVRAAAGAVRAPVAFGRRGQDPDEGNAQTEARPARRRAHCAAAEGRQLSGSDAPAQAGAD